MARGERLAPARGGERTRSPLDCGVVSSRGRGRWCGRRACYGLFTSSVQYSTFRPVCLLWLFVWLGVGGGLGGSADTCNKSYGEVEPPTYRALGIEHSGPLTPHRTKPKTPPNTTALAHRTRHRTSAQAGR